MGHLCAVSEERAQWGFGVGARACFMLAFKVTFHSLLPALSPWLLELTDGAFKARAMGPWINFCSWNLLDVCVACELREPMRRGGAAAEQVAYLGTPGTALTWKISPVTP